MNLIHYRRKVKANKFVLNAITILLYSYNDNEYYGAHTCNFLDVPRSFPKKTLKKVPATSRPLQQLKNYSDKKLDCNGLCPLPGQPNTFLLVEPNNDAIKRVTLGKYENDIRLSDIR